MISGKEQPVWPSENEQCLKTSSRGTSVELREIRGGSTSPHLGGQRRLTQETTAEPSVERQG